MPAGTLLARHHSRRTGQAGSEAFAAKTIDVFPNPADTAVWFHSAVYESSQGIQRIKPSRQNLISHLISCPVWKQNLPTTNEPQPSIVPPSKLQTLAKRLMKMC